MKSRGLTTMFLVLNLSLFSTGLACSNKGLGNGTLGKTISGIVEMCSNGMFKSFDVKSRKSIPNVKWVELYQIADADGNNFNEAAGDDIKSRLTSHGFRIVASHPDDNGGGVVIFNHGKQYVSMAIFNGGDGGYMGLVSSVH